MTWLGLAESQKNSFVAFVTTWLTALTMLLFFAAIVIFPAIGPTKEVWATERIPYWLALLGTFAGMVGASSPARTLPDPEQSKWRDRFSLWGWVLLFFGALSALMYV